MGFYTSCWKIKTRKIENEKKPMGNRFDRLEHLFNEKLGTVDQRMEQVSSHLDRVERISSRFVDEVAGISRRLDEIDRRTRRLESFHDDFRRFSLPDRVKKFDIGTDKILPGDALLERDEDRVKPPRYT